MALLNMHKPSVSPLPWVWSCQIPLLTAMSSAEDRPRPIHLRVLQGSPIQEAPIHLTFLQRGPGAFDDLAMSTSVTRAIL